MDVQTWMLLGMMAVVSFALWGRVVFLEAEAFKWRKRWIIERFGAGVEGSAGDYFIVTSYSNGVPCLTFAKRRRDLSFHGTAIRRWNSFMGRDPLGENCDMPDEKAVGLPEDPTRDSRPWIAAGFGLCQLPPPIHERAERNQGQAR